MLRKLFTIAVLTCSSFASPAKAQTLPVATHAETGVETSIPYGWVDFCRRYANECGHGARQAQDIVLSQKSLRDLERVNHNVNTMVQAVSDMDHWGVVDQWDYPTDGKGDCEDYVLEKRRQLIQLGYPRQALLVTVVKDKLGDGHAILTVRTTAGDFILDNLESRILDWRRTGYRFVKRQSQTDEDVWVSIGSPTAAPAYVSK